jgi:type II secretory pathway predicted ATPase ExeA
LAYRLQEELAREGKVLVARSLSVDKERVTLQTLMMALFFDLSPEEEPWIPSQGERRERELRRPSGFPCMGGRLTISRPWPW